MKKLFYYLFAILAIVACSNSDVDNGGSNGGGQETPKQPTIQLSATASDFKTAGGTVNIMFTTTESWTAEVINTDDYEWCSINPMSGDAGDATISITTQPNNTPHNRSASVVIKSGKSSKTISIEQDKRVVTHEEERNALIALYKSLNGDNWTIKTNWCSDKPVGEWWGVVVNNNGFVERLELVDFKEYKDLNMQGVIPNEIGDLIHLDILRIERASGLIGPLPNRLFDLSLSDLTLTYTGLDGNIPEGIGKMKKLETLDLSFNHLIGEIPAFIGELEKLRNLLLMDNGLTGDVPKSIQKLALWEYHWHYIVQQDYNKGGYINPESLDIPFPKFNFTTLDGENISDSYFEDKKYTVYYHYGLNCPFAEVFTPKLVKYYEFYKEHGMGVFSLGTPHITTEVDMRSYMTSFGITWPNVFLTMDEATDIRFWDYLQSMPTVCVIDSNKKVVFNHVSHDYNTLIQFLEEKFGVAYEENDILYESTDYSKDGEIKQIQVASKGNGIDIVLMGDAYSDRLIADGTYDKDMEIAMEKFFEVEPYKSFRDYFNIYSVTAVSKNETIGVDGAETALCTYLGALEGGESLTQVGGDDAKVFEYASKAISSERMNEVLIITLMNINTYAGTCYMYNPEITGGYSSGPSISYFPLGGNAETFAQMLHHEACGHGFAKLADEYAYKDMGAAPSDYVSQIQSQQRSWGWWKNVDFTSDPTATRWSHFVNDTRYVNEGLGAYEGGLTYWTGVWRPTENSIMRYNTGGFNAPSREAIYYRIHKLAYGDSWEYNYEDFVEWDARNRTTAATRAMVYKPTNYKPTHPPVIVNKSWKDAK